MLYHPLLVMEEESHFFKIPNSTSVGFTTTPRIIVVVFGSGFLITLVACLAMLVMYPIMFYKGLESHKKMKRGKKATARAGKSDGWKRI